MKLLCLTLPLLCLIACAGRTPAPRATIGESSNDHAREVVVPPDMVITTGVHGNEPSGYLIQDELIDIGFTVFGPCNPWGIRNDSRFLEDGQDLNRIFAKDDAEEVRAVKEFLDENPPGLLLDLHEDPDGKGAYLIQHGPDDDIGRRIIEALSDRYEFEPEPRFLMVSGEDGLLKPTMEHLRALALLGVYGLAYHAWKTFGCTSIVVECPGSWPEVKRKQYQRDVVQTAARLYAEE